MAAGETGSPYELGWEEREDVVELPAATGDGADDFDPESFTWPAPPPDSAGPDTVAGWVAVMLTASGPEGPAPAEMLAPYVATWFLEEYELAASRRISTTEPTVRTATLIDATVFEDATDGGGPVVNVALEVATETGFDVLSWEMRMVRGEEGWLVDSVMVF